MKPKALVFALIVFALPANAQDFEHRVDPGQVNPGAVSLNAFNRRIEDVAADTLKRYPPGAVSRTALYDAVLPIDAAEFKASGGFGILLISAISRIKSELPPSSVAVGRVKLRLLGNVSRALPRGAAATAYGPFRADSFWLVPANLFDDASEITLDFAENRKGFVLGHGLGKPDYLRDMTPASSGVPNFAVLRKLIAREYPGFGIEVPR